MKIQFTTIKTIVAMLFMSLLFSTQSFAQFHRHHLWNDSIPRNDTAHFWHPGHGLLDSLHNWLDSAHAHFHLDSGFVHNDTGHMHIDSGFNWNDSGHVFNDSGFHWNDSGFFHFDSGHVHLDSGFNWNDSGFGHLDSGFNWNDSGHVFNDSGFHFNDSGFNWNDSGHVFNDSGFNWNDSGFTWNDSGFGHNDTGNCGGHHRMANPNGSSDAVSITIYPNPVVESAIIHIANTSGNVLFRMYDANGRLAMERTLPNGDFQLDKANIGAAGLYFYQINDGNTSVANGRLIFQ